jgi:hypothetical protein
MSKTVTLIFNSGSEPPEMFFGGETDTETAETRQIFCEWMRAAVKELKGADE